MLHQQSFDSYDDLLAQLTAHGYDNLDASQKEIARHAFSIHPGRTIHGAFTDKPVSGRAFVVLRQRDGFYAEEIDRLENSTPAGIVVLYCIP